MPTGKIIGMCLLFSSVSVAVAADDPVRRTGPWRAWLETPGGELPFTMVISRRHDTWHVQIINGRERIEVPGTVFEGSEFVLDIDHYDATIRATLCEDGKRMDGQWRRRRGKDSWTELPFHATFGNQPRFARDNAVPKSGSGPGVDGRWLVKFSKSKDPAIGVFETRSDGTVIGTFLTTTGDYRFLAGGLDGSRLRLSTFDGAHAFLFDARLQDDGTLKGDFWSGDKWHETWSGRRDFKAEIAEGFDVTKWNPSVKLSDLKFSDLDGKSRSLADPAFSGKVRIIELFGSWCPNCHDAARLLSDLDQKYRDKGLSIVGVAFERSGDFARDVRQVRRFAKRNKVKYPVLLAGSPAGVEQRPSFPAIEKIRAYPTTIFLDAKGRVRTIHTGFSGPATGKDHLRLRRKFVDLIEEMIKE